jgi:hypothetical protein
LVEGVIAMVGHLGRYRQKRIDFQCEQAVLANVNPQEIKQVVLNLITNALDSLDADGAVQVVLRRTATAAELEVSDDGCGMTDEVMQHLFEPFFHASPRRTGHRTGTLDRLWHHPGPWRRDRSVQRRPRPRFAFSGHVALVAQQERNHVYETKSKVA